MARCATKANTETTTINPIHASTTPTANRPRMLSGHHFLFAAIATVYARQGRVGGNESSAQIPPDERRGAPVVSALLRQPGGFEGLGAVLIGDHPDGLVIAISPHLSDVVVDLYSAAAATPPRVD